MASFKGNEVFGNADVSASFSAELKKQN